VTSRNAKIGRAIPLEIVMDMVEISSRNFVELVRIADNAFVYDNNGAPEDALVPLFSLTEYYPPWIDIEEHENGQETEVLQDVAAGSAEIYCAPGLATKYPTLYTHLQTLCEGEPTTRI
jgi:hypothetical protein